MKINRKELQEVLSEASKIINKKSYDPKDKQVFIGPYSGGACLIVVRTNEVVLRCLIHREGKLDKTEKVWVDAETLKLIVSGKCGPDETVEVTRDGERVVIDCDSVATKISTFPDPDGLMKTGKRKWEDKFNEVEAGEFHSSLSYVITSMCDDELRENVYGAHFDFKEGELACCNHCSFKTSKINKIEMESLTIAPRAVKALVRISKVTQKKDAICKMYMEKTKKRKPAWVVFSFCSEKAIWNVQAKLMTEEYAKYREAIPSESFCVGASAEKIEKHIDRFKKMKLDSVKIGLRSSAKEMSLEFGEDDGTHVFMQVPVEMNEYKNEEEKYEIIFDPSFLKEAFVGTGKGESVRMHFSFGGGMAPLLVELENENSMLLAPMRMS